MHWTPGGFGLLGFFHIYLEHTTMWKGFKFLKGSQGQATASVVLEVHAPNEAEVLPEVEEPTAPPDTPVVPAVALGLMDDQPISIPVARTGGVAQALPIKFNPEQPDLPRRYNPYATETITFDPFYIQVSSGYIDPGRQG